MTMASPVSVERSGDVSVVTLHRPPHNFLDAEFLSVLAGALEDAASDSRAAVIASEGRSFCAGANFRAGIALAPGEPGGEPPDFVTQARAFYSEATRVFEVALPIVAAVDGPAIGAGLGLALACDLLVMGKDAWVSANFVKLGIHPGFAMTHTLPLRVGPGRAAGMMLTGRRVSAGEAESMGLADRIVGSGSVRQAAVDLATEIAAAAPLAVTATRATLRSGLAGRAAEAMEKEALAQAALVTTGDCAEGIAAMLEKRTPAFTGR